MKEYRHTVMLIIVYLLIIESIIIFQLFSAEKIIIIANFLVLTANIVN